MARGFQGLQETHGAPSREQLQAALVERQGQAMQQALADARVGIAGLGGLGSNVAVSLARIGVGHLHLVDFDVVDITNLNRQHYFWQQIGMPKAQALPQVLACINPYIDIEAQQVRVTAQNACRIFANDHIVCEAFDVPQNKAMLVNALLEGLPATPVVSASGMAGFGRSNSIRTRHAFGNLYVCGDGATEPDPTGNCGLMAPRVAICANHQANLIVWLILKAHGIVDGAWGGAEDEDETSRSTTEDPADGGRA